MTDKFKVISEMMAIRAETNARLFALIDTLCEMVTPEDVRDALTAEGFKHSDDYGPHAEVWTHPCGEDALVPKVAGKRMYARTVRECVEAVCAAREEASDED